MNKLEENPLVSVVAICHNHAAFVVETLDSIKNQTYPNIQLIIINNKKDECEPLIKDWIAVNNVKCEFIQNERLLNVSQNCNLGLSRAEGKYFQMISADDVMLPEKIEKQVNLFENSQDEKLGCVFSNFYKFDENGKYIERNVDLNKKLVSDNFKKQLIKSSTISAPTALLKKEVIDKVGRYDDSVIVEDYYMWLELLRNGYSFAAVNEPLVRYRVLSNSLYQTRSLVFFESMLKIYERNLALFKGENNGAIFYAINMYRRYGGKFGFGRMVNLMIELRCYNLYYLIRAMIEPSYSNLIKNK